MESDKCLVFEGYRKGDLYMVEFSAGPQLAVCLLAKASMMALASEARACWHEELVHTHEEETRRRH